MFRLAPLAVAAVLLAAAVPASAGVVTGGSIAGADAASQCAAGPGLSCAAAQTQIGALTRAAAAPGVVTTWRALGSGASGIFIAQITGDGTLTRLRTSALATVSNVPTPQPTRLPIAAGQFVGLIAPNGSSIAYREGPVPGAESFAWLPAPAEGVTTPSSGSANPVVGAYEATIEPDADNDGFGDETQDKCLKEATRVPGAPCDPPAFTATPKVKTVRQGAKSVLVFTISEAATLKATIDRKAKGRKVGKKCKAPTRKNRKKRRCTRYTGKRTLTLAAKAGANKLSLGKRKAGTYRLTIVATDATGAAAAPVKTTFKVKPKKKRKR